MAADQVGNLPTSGFGEHHDSPENDPQLLRNELDHCRAHIHELRLELHEAVDARERLLDALKRIRRSTASPSSLRSIAAQAIRFEGCQ